MRAGFDDVKARNAGVEASPETLEGQHCLEFA